MRFAVCVVVAILSLSGSGAGAAVAPGVELADGGRTIVYRARPGDTPAGVAQALGVPVAQIDALLAARGMAQGSDVPVGFEYRVPNPLAARLDAVERRAADLEREAAAARARAGGAGGQRGGVQSARQLHTEQHQRLAQLEGRWWLAFWAILALSIALAVAGAVAAVALRRERGARGFARSMAQELEEKRRSGLAERQQTARRIVELEDRLRQLEVQCGERPQAVPRTA